MDSLQVKVTPKKRPAKPKASPKKEKKQKTTASTPVVQQITVSKKVVQVEEAKEPEVIDLVDVDTAAMNARFDSEFMTFQRESGETFDELPEHVEPNPYPGRVLSSQDKEDYGNVLNLSSSGSDGNAPKNKEVPGQTGGTQGMSIGEVVQIQRRETA